MTSVYEEDLKVVDSSTHPEQGIGHAGIRAGDRSCRDPSWGSVMPGSELGIVNSGVRGEVHHPHIRRFRVYTGGPVKHGRVFLVYLVKSDLSSVHVYSSVHWTSHFFQGTRKTLPCLTGNPV